jgi:hypothetical protein
VLQKNTGHIILESLLTISANIHNAVMAFLPEERRNREKVDADEHDGLSLGPLRPAGSADQYGVPMAEE